MVVGKPTILGNPNILECYHKYKRYTFYFEKTCLQAQNKHVYDLCMFNICLEYYT